MTTVAYYKDCLIADKRFLDNSEKNARILNLKDSKIYTSECKRIAFTRAGDVLEEKDNICFTEIIIEAIRNFNLGIDNTDKDKNNIDDLKINFGNSDVKKFLILTKTQTFTACFQSKKLIKLSYVDSSLFFAEGTGKWYFITAAQTNMPIDYIIPFVSSIDMFTSAQFDVVNRDSLKDF